MSKKANTTLIGAFVIGAAVLAVAAVLIFGGGKFLKESYTYVAYFEGSIAGLNVGAPVMFRGVQVGSITDIRLEFEVSEEKDISARIPVYFDLEPHRVTRIGGKQDPYGNMQLMIERGLRAQLQLQSFVTGQLMVELDLHPDKPARLLGVQGEYPEIPTIPTNIQELSKTIEKLPIDELFTKLLSTIEGIDKTVNSPEITQSISSMRQTLDSVQKLVGDIKEEVGPLTISIKDTVKDTQKLVQRIEGEVEPLTTGIKDIIKDARKLVQRIEEEVEPLTASIKSTSDAGATAMEEAKKTLAAIQGLATEDSPLIYELMESLKELSAAARSLRILADHLERHPEALIKGKEGPKGEGEGDE